MNVVIIHLQICIVNFFSTHMKSERKKNKTFHFEKNKKNKNVRTEQFGADCICNKLFI